MTCRDSGSINLDAFTFTFTFSAQGRTGSANLQFEEGKSKKLISISLAPTIQLETTT